MAPRVVAPTGTALASVAGRPRGPLPVLAPNDEELAAHAAYLAALDTEAKGRCLWLALGSAATA
jgi:hypothetical protein